MSQLRSNLNLTLLGCEGKEGNIANCCLTTNLCGLYQGNCQIDEHCTYDLICGTNNYGNDFPMGTNCCRMPFPCNGTHEQTEHCCSSTNLCTVNQGNCEVDSDCIGNLQCGKNNCNSNFPNGTNCLSLSSLFKRRTVTTDMHFLLHCIHKNEFILYSGSQSYIAASFSTVRGYETRRKVFGDPFNG